jgi:hypothetical protein
MPTAARDGAAGLAGGFSGGSGYHSARPGFGASLPIPTAVPAPSSYRRSGAQLWEGKLTRTREPPFGIRGTSTAKSCTEGSGLSQEEGELKQTEPPAPRAGKREPN